MAATTAALRIPARELLAPDELAALRERVEWKGIALIAHAWAVILGSIALVAIFPNPLTYIACGRADRLAPARARDPDARRRARLLVAQRNAQHVAQPMVLRLSGRSPRRVAYRRYHLQHHQRTQQEDDPDLVLSAPFPITKASYRRKFWRDITGPDRLRAAQGADPERARRSRMAAGDSACAHFGDKLGPQIAVNAVLLAGSRSPACWWAYPLLWLVPLMTWMMVITRIRNIAEHAVVPDGDDPLRNTRTTQANLIERALVAPYFVNYHLEHHLLYYVPCYNLPKLHAIMMRGPACAAHGGAAELSERAAARDRQARRGRPARRDRQHRAAQTCRHAGQRGSRTRGILEPRQLHWIAITRIAAGPRMTMNSTGRKNRIIGTVSLGGSAAAFFSASDMRMSRFSCAITRSVWPSGVP